MASTGAGGREAQTASSHMPGLSRGWTRGWNPKRRSSIIHAYSPLIEWHSYKGKIYSVHKASGEVNKSRIESIRMLRDYTIIIQSWSTARAQPTNSPFVKRS